MFVYDLAKNAVSMEQSSKNERQPNISFQCMCFGFLAAKPNRNSSDIVLLLSHYSTT
jgi:hypothetical protein